MCLEGPADLKRALFLLALTAGGEPLVRKLGMILHSHTAEKQAVSVKGAQERGNPLRLRRALDVGVTVVMVHCASLGRSEDLDHPGRRVRSFELFQRLMGEARCRDHPSGDLAASTQINRPPGQFRELLRRPELQERLLQVSAYPLSEWTWSSGPVRSQACAGSPRRNGWSSMNSIKRTRCSSTSG